MLSIVIAANDHALEMLQCPACSRHEWRYDGQVIRSEAATRIAADIASRTAGSKHAAQRAAQRAESNVISLSSGQPARRGA
jgi:hypothetical protein